MALGIGKRIHNPQGDTLKYLVEIETGTKEQSSFVAPSAVDFVADIAGSSNASTVRLSCGVMLRANHSAAELVAKLRPFCNMIPTSAGFLNIAAVVGITPSGPATMLRLRGGSAVAIAQDLIAVIDEAMAKAHGLSPKAVA